MPFLVAAGGGDTDVLAEVQGSVLGAQQTALSLPVAVRGVPGRMAGAGIGRVHRVVYLIIYPRGAETGLNNCVARLL